MRNVRALAVVFAACLSMAAIDASIDTVAATPRLISVGFNSSLNNPQQIGADAFKQELEKHFKGRVSIDERGTNTFGSEGYFSFTNAINPGTTEGFYALALGNISPAAALPQTIASTAPTAWVTVPL